MKIELLETVFFVITDRFESNGCNFLVVTKIKKAYPKEVLTFFVIGKTKFLSFYFMTQLSI